MDNNGQWYPGPSAPVGYPPAPAFQHQHQWPAQPAMSQHISPQQVFQQQAMQQEAMQQQAMELQTMSPWDFQPQAFQSQAFQPQAFQQQAFQQQAFQDQAFQDQAFQDQAFQDQASQQQQAFQQWAMPPQVMPQGDLQLQDFQHPYIHQSVVQQQVMPQQCIPQQGSPQQGLQPPAMQQPPMQQPPMQQSPVQQQVVPQQAVQQQAVQQQNVQQQDVQQQDVQQQAIQQQAVHEPAAQPQAVPQQALQQQAHQQVQTPAQTFEEKKTAFREIPQAHPNPVARPGPGRKKKARPFWPPANAGEDLKADYEELHIAHERVEGAEKKLNMNRDPSKAVHYQKMVLRNMQTRETLWNACELEENDLPDNAPLEEHESKMTKLHDSYLESCDRLQTRRNELMAEHPELVDPQTLQFNERGLSKKERESLTSTRNWNNRYKARCSRTYTKFYVALEREYQGWPLCYQNLKRIHKARCYNFVAAMMWPEDPRSREEFSTLDEAAWFAAWSRYQDRDNGLLPPQQSASIAHEQSQTQPDAQQVQNQPADHLNGQEAAAEPDDLQDAMEFARDDLEEGNKIRTAMAEIQNIHNAPAGANKHQPPATGTGDLDAEHEIVPEDGGDVQDEQEDVNLCDVPGEDLEAEIKRWTPDDAEQSNQDQPMATADGNLDSEHSGDVAMPDHSPQNTEEGKPDEASEASDDSLFGPE